MPLVVECQPPIKRKTGLDREGDLSTMKAKELTLELARRIYKTCRDLELKPCLIQGWVKLAEVDQTRAESYPLCRFWPG